MADEQNRILKKIQARDKPNPRWSSSHNNALLTIQKRPIVKNTDTIFTIGSCFAERIRIFLEEMSIKVAPPMQDIVLDDDRFRIDRLPQRPHMNYYNTFTIRQEFERHAGQWKQDDDDYWETKDIYWGQEKAYQDPYRRIVYGRTPEDLANAVQLCNEAVDKGIRESRVFFITFGMAEVFRNKKSGKIACQKPGYAKGAGEEQTEYYMSSYEENHENISRVIEIINSIHSNAEIVLTVSPVGLGRTFSDNDILVANTEGKSLLRAVVGDICRKHSNVTYFPSYEIVMNNAPFSFREDDGRHISDWTVNDIVTAFKAAHVESEE